MPAAEGGKSGAWRNAYLAIAMLTVDISRRGEAAVTNQSDQIKVIYYQRLIAKCEQGKIDKIIVFRIDRMTRSTKDFCEFDEKMKNLGVGFTSVSEPFVDTSSPMGELVVNLIVSFGQWERKTIQERIKRHFQTALEQGYFVGGVPSFGYKVDDHTLVPDPETAHLVKGKQVALVTRDLWDKAHAKVKEVEDIKVTPDTL